MYLSRRRRRRRQCPPNNFCPPGFQCGPRTHHFQSNIMENTADPRAMRPRCYGIRSSLWQQTHRPLWGWRDEIFAGASVRTDLFAWVTLCLPLLMCWRNNVDLFGGECNNILTESRLKWNFYTWNSIILNNSIIWKNVSTIALN